MGVYAHRFIEVLDKDNKWKALPLWNKHEEGAYGKPDIIDGELIPFFKIVYYTKNYHNTGKNRENDIYFYVIKTDAEFDMNKANLDEGERHGGYVAKTLPLEGIEKVLMDSIPDNKINEVIVNEMLEVIKEYKEVIE